VEEGGGGDIGDRGGDGVGVVQVVAHGGLVSAVMVALTQLSMLGFEALGGNSSQRL
jgi:hypothetical protein